MNPKDIGIRLDQFASSLLEFICDEKIKQIMNFISVSKLAATERMKSDLNFYDFSKNFTESFQTDYS